MATISTGLRAAGPACLNCRVILVCGLSCSRSTRTASISSGHSAAIRAAPSCTAAGSAPYLSRPIGLCLPSIFCPVSVMQGGPSGGPLDVSHLKVEAKTRLAKGLPIALRGGWCSAFAWGGLCSSVWSLRAARVNSFTGLVSGLLRLSMTSRQWC